MNCLIYTKHVFPFSFLYTHTQQSAITEALTTESVSKPPVKPKVAKVKGSWFTLAAIGVGALVVGTLAMKS